MITSISLFEKQLTLSIPKNDSSQAVRETYLLRHLQFTKMALIEPTFADFYIWEGIC